MYIKRDKYLNDIINRMHNGMIKVITGIRRSGKSYLVFNIFNDYLKSEDVSSSRSWNRYKWKPSGDSR